MKKKVKAKKSPLTGLKEGSKKDMAMDKKLAKMKKVKKAVKTVKKSAKKK